MQRKTDVLKNCITQALLSLLKKKNLNVISIKEITEKAGVNRSTYYRNFNSKNDIIKYYFDKLHNEYYIKSRINDIIDENTISKLFGYYYKHKNELLLIHKNGLSYLILDSLNEIFKPVAKKQTYYEVLKIYFHAGGIFNVILLWLSNGMKNMSKPINELKSLLYPQ